MSGFRGTPGPWVHHEPSGYQHSMGGYILGRQGKICDVSGFDVGSDAAKENGKLIAAAPELLEALQEMVAIVKKHTYPQPDKPSSTWGRMEAAEAVISKALGQ